MNGNKKFPPSRHIAAAFLSLTIFFISPAPAAAWCETCNQDSLAYDLAHRFNLSIAEVKKFLANRAHGGSETETRMRAAATEGNYRNPSGSQQYEVAPEADYRYPVGWKQQEVTPVAADYRYPSSRQYDVAPEADYRYPVGWKGNMNQEENVSKDNNNQNRINRSGTADQQEHLRHIDEKLDPAIRSGRLTEEQRSKILNKLSSLMKIEADYAERTAVSKSEGRSRINAWARTMNKWLKTQNYSLAELSDITGKGNKYLMAVDY